MPKSSPFQKPPLTCPDKKFSSGEFLGTNVFYLLAKRAWRNLLPVSSYSHRPSPDRQTLAANISETLDGI